MTDLESRALGQRWLSAGGGWRVGMRVLAMPDAGGEPDDDAISTAIAVVSDCVTVAWSTYAGTAEGGTLLRDDVPDFRDTATVGACLAVVRERWADPGMYASPWPPGWAVNTGNDNPRWKAPTEAEALIAALESKTLGAAP